MCIIVCYGSRTTWWLWSIRMCCQLNYQYHYMRKCECVVMLCCCQSLFNYCTCTHTHTYTHTHTHTHTYSVFFTNGLKYNYELLLFCELIKVHKLVRSLYPSMFLSLFFLASSQGGLELRLKTVFTYERNTSQQQRKMN